jgi:aerobic C4-dicarboxylate transport protein
MSGWHSSFWRRLDLQVLVAIAVGLLLGAFDPSLGKAMKPFGDAFIALIRMMIGPLVFCTVVHGIGSMRDTARVGRIGVKALIYFELVSTFALVIGLAAGHLVRPGEGLSASTVSAENAKAVAGYVTHATGSDADLTTRLLRIIPDTLVGAFTAGDMLQVLLVAILSGVAISLMAESGAKITAGVELIGRMLFRMVGLVVRIAPLGAFGALAYTVGQFGVHSLMNLGVLIVTFFLACALFVFLVLGVVARTAGFSLLDFLAYLREELLIILGTASSEPVLPNLMRKMERLGASDSVVGLVVPIGYSFNLDGTNIYMTLAILFLAQATGTHLDWSQEATILIIAMVTSKGASGVSGAGFVTLAATLSVVPDIPITSLGLLLGIDRIMGQGRSLTNFIGNGVATLVIARWEGELDRNQLRNGPLRGHAASRGASVQAADPGQQPASGSDTV